MYIGYISTFPPFHCGVGEYTYLLSTSIKNVDENVEIEVFSVEESIDSPFKVFKAFEKGKSEYKDLVDLIKKEGPFDIIHIQHEFGIFPPHKNFIKLLEELKENTRGLVVTFHTVYRSSYKEYMDIQKSILEIVDAAVVHTHLQEFELFLQSNLIEKIFRIPHGTKFHTKVQKKKAIKLLDLPIDENSIVISIPGFIRKDKGIENLIEVIKKVIKDKENIYLVIAGEVTDNEYGNLVKDKLKDELGKNYSFISKYLSNTELSLLINLSDIIVFPYNPNLKGYSVSGMFHYVLGSNKIIVSSRVPRLVEEYLVAPDLTYKHKDLDKLYYILKNSIDFLESKNSEINISDYLVKLQKLASITSWENIAKAHLKLYRYVAGFEDYKEIRKQELEKFNSKVIESIDEEGLKDSLS